MDQGARRIGLTGKICPPLQVSSFKSARGGEGDVCYVSRQDEAPRYSASLFSILLVVARDL